MNVSRALLQARRRAGLSQRQLAVRAQVPQSTIARIETGRLDPRVGTIDRILRACDSEIEVLPRLGAGIDRSLIREQLRMSPRRRVEEVVRVAEQMSRIRGVALRKSQ